MPGEVLIALKGRLGTLEVNVGVSASEESVTRHQFLCFGVLLILILFLLSSNLCSHLKSDVLLGMRL